jgi:tetratricopeptide (TPR) repeat protein
MNEKHFDRRARRSSARPARRRLWAAALLVSASLSGGAALVTSPVEARADAATEASEHFQRGVEFSKDGDFEAALVEFKRAYELSPNYRVLFNLGQTSRELRDYAGALKSFEEYLRQGGNDAPKRDKVEQWISELKGKVASINVKVTPAGAEVLVDDVSVGQAPLKGPVVVNAGKRKVSATLSGYTPLQKYVDLAGTDTKSVEIELAPVGAPQGGKDKGSGGGDTGSVPPRKSSPAPWIALAGTGAAAVLTGVFGGLALSSKSDLQKALDTFPGNAKDIEAKRSKTRTFAATADVMGGITGAGAVVTIVLFATQPKGEAQKDKKAFIAPTLGIGPGSLQLSGSF